MFGIKKQSSKEAASPTKEAKKSEPINHGPLTPVIKELQEKGLKQYALDVLGITEEDLETISNKSEKGKTTSLTDELGDMLPHVNEAYRKNSRVISNLNKTSEAELRRRIRQIVSSNAKLESRESIRLLLVLVGGLLKKRFN
jgi:hypothetical protein